jgi:hypothetical protein
MYRQLKRVFGPGNVSGRMRWAWWSTQTGMPASPRGDASPATSRASGGTHPKHAVPLEMEGVDAHQAQALLRIMGHMEGLSTPGPTDKRKCACALMYRPIQHGSGWVPRQVANSKDMIGSW